MAIKKVDITIPKLDYKAIPLSIKENGQLVELGENDLLYMTVAKSPYKDYTFQKSLENGITYDSITKKYIIEITSNDTKDLEYGYDYGYDITIYYDGNKPKQKIIGTFTITDKYTVNEVVSNG